MHARSLPRWISLTPRARSVPSSSRPRIAAYSDVSPSDLSPAPPLDPSPWINVLKSAKDLHDTAKKVVVDAAASEDVPLDRRIKRIKRKPYKPMEGKSMKPVSVKGTRHSLEPSDGVILQTGVCLDQTFKPLKDVNKWRRNHVPKLAHGLEKVLSRQGVHWLRDPETEKYNFDQILEKIPQPHEFAFDRLPGFVPSSQDESLIAYARKSKCKYIGSTSSLTGILTQIYLLLSDEKLVSLDNLSAEFASAARFYTPGQRIPVSVFLRYQDGVFTTDIDDERDDDKSEIILLPLGTLLEKFLTLPKKTFNKFLKSHTAENYPHLKDVHRYAKHGKFLMRSQLDCVDDSLPGTGVFDLKTRAISPIRHDVRNYLNYLDVSLTSITGRRGTFEEEYYDMIRAAFLEYSFQARIGNMDGVMVAYHNTARIFGFQYVSLKEMDLCLFGKEGAGARVFQRCVWIMEMLYKHITQCFPNQSVKTTFEKGGKLLRVWVEPMENPNPGAEPPVVELQLSLTNIVHGKPARGPYAIYSDNPWSIQYKLERFDQPQETIRARRARAYKRQESIAASLPDPEVQADAADTCVEDTEGNGYSSKPASEVEDLSDLLGLRH
ncbi:Pet127-domain-containing protein [Dichomitus squalens]|nr:Pet127-domain-containing protein [Dichomitus squalens]